MTRMLLALTLALALACASAEESYDLNEFGAPVERFDLNTGVVLPVGAVQVDAELCMLAVTGLNLPTGQSSCLVFEAPDEEALAADVLERFRAAGYEVGAAQPVMEGVSGYRLTTSAWAHSLLLVTNTNSPGYLSVTIVLLPFPTARELVLVELATQVVPAPHMPCWVLHSPKRE